MSLLAQLGPHGYSEESNEPLAVLIGIGLLALYTVWYHRKR